MFAGFDLEYHRQFTPGSPSVQIDISAIHAALQDGLGFDRKSNDEIAVGVRPDTLVPYLLNARSIHATGSTPAGAALLAIASSGGTIADVDMLKLSQARQRTVRQVSALSRTATFRQQVLQAYNFRCAVTRMQLKLVEAAHILPITAGDSSIDHVTNGVALSPTYHRAFDRGLIYLTTDHRFVLNGEQARLLEDQGVGAGLYTFAKTLGRIHLPPDPAQRPLAALIRKANRFRNIRE
jgi:putative restriction endonuclease